MAYRDHWLSAEFGVPLDDVVAVAEQFGNQGRATASTRVVHLTRCHRTLIQPFNSSADRSSSVR